MTKDELFASDKSILQQVNMLTNSNNGCTYCTYCTGCTDCTGIINGQNLQYVAYGVQLMKEEYEEFLEK